MRAVYICSKYSGRFTDKFNETRDAEKYCRYVYEKCGHLPIAPQLYFPHFLDLEKQSDRNFLREMTLKLIASCDEFWYFGDQITTEMVTEILAAKELKIPVRYVRSCEIEGKGESSDEKKE